MLGSYCRNQGFLDPSTPLSSTVRFVLIGFLKNPALHLARSPSCNMQIKEYRYSVAWLLLRLRMGNQLSVELLARHCTAGTLTSTACSSWSSTRAIAWPSCSTPSTVTRVASPLPSSPAWSLRDGDVIDRLPVTVVDLQPVPVRGRQGATCSLSTSSRSPSRDSRMSRYIQPAEPVYQVQPPRPVWGATA